MKLLDTLRRLCPFALVLLAGCAQEAREGPSERDLARASALYDGAVRALQEGDTLEAMNLLNEGLAFNPDSREMHVARASYGERLSLFEEVIESTEWLLRSDPKNPELLERIIRSCLNCGRMDTARRALAKLKKADPGSARTEALAARFYFENGELGNAEKHATRSAELVPNQTDAHHVIGLSREFAGEPELAIESFRRVIFVDPGHLGARDHLATLLLRLDRRKESKKHRDIHTALIRAMPGGFRHFAPAVRMESFGEITKMIPKWEFGHMELARALMQDGQLEAAQASLEAALALSPRHSESNELMASLMRRLGKHEEAKSYSTIAGSPWGDENP